MLYQRELIVDSFAGGGGASLGISLALGRGPDIAINHDAEAIALHAANHPETKHLSKNIWKVDPIDAVGAAPIGLLWASPDCKHFSKAKGGKPLKRNIRDLAWVVVMWAERKRPRVIILENVEEFQDWGPVLLDGMPCPDNKGVYFRKFVRQLERLGYRVEWRELRGCDYGAPTIRKRLFLVARCDRRPITWPEATHGPANEPAVIAGLKKPYRLAADIINWSLPCPSIFLTKKEGAAAGVKRPLVPATMARIAKGVRRYVLETATPFIVPVTHQGDSRVHNIREPLRTVTTAQRGEHALISPTLIQTGYGERQGQEPRVPGLEKPLGTVVAGGCKHALVAPILSSLYSERRPSDDRCSDTRRPMPTVTAAQRHGVVAAFLAQHNTDMVGHDAREPVSTIVQKGCTQAIVSAGLVNLKGSDRRMAGATSPAPTVTAGGYHLGEVRAFLVKYFGTHQDPRLDEPLHTVTTKHRFGLVTVEGELFQIADIGMRMLTPRELFRAQGFPDTYIIDPVVNGRPLTKTAQIRMCGNSVNPQVAQALVMANYAMDVIPKRARRATSAPLLEAAE